MRSKICLIVAALCRVRDKIKVVRAGEVVGIAILAFAAWVYWGNTWRKLRSARLRLERDYLQIGASN